MKYTITPLLVALACAMGFYWNSTQEDWGSEIIGIDTEITGGEFSDNKFKFYNQTDLIATPKGNSFWYSIDSQTLDVFELVEKDPSPIVEVLGPQLQEYVGESYNTEVLTLHNSAYFFSVHFPGTNQAYMLIDPIENGFYTFNLSIEEMSTIHFYDQYMRTIFTYIGDIDKTISFTYSEGIFYYVN